MKRILLLLVLALGAAIAWWTVSPRNAVEELRTAVRTGDADALESVVAFDSVRANLRTDLRVWMSDHARTDDPVVALGVALGGVLADGLIDAFVSPSGLTTLLRGGVPGMDEPPSDDAAEYDIERTGIDRFLVRFPDEDAGDVRPVLEFRRHALSWRMVRIRLEDGSPER